MSPDPRLWLEERDPVRLLALVRPRLSERKLRLFGAACCRRVWHLLIDDRSRQAVELAERLADEEVSEEERVQAVRRADAVLGEGAGTRPPFVAAQLEAAEAAAWAGERGDFLRPLLRAVQEAADLMARHKARGGLTETIRAGQRAQERINAELLELLHDLVGAQFRERTFESAWRTPTVVAVAQGLYLAQDFAALPVLADALEEAGCDDAALLAHCRAGGLHARGCWTLDGVLDRA